MEKLSDKAKVIAENLANADNLLSDRTGGFTAERLLSEVHQDLCKSDTNGQRDIIKQLQDNQDVYGYVKLVEGEDNKLLGMRYHYLTEPSKPDELVFIRLDNCDK